MCILFIAKDCHPDWPLIVAANRDEFFARPSSPMAFWTDAPDVLAGRDLEAGGTWLGVNRDGRFAAVTNFRNPDNPNSDALSRGALVAGYLTAARDDTSWKDRLAFDHDAYNPFNLVFGDRHQLFAWDHVAKRNRKLSTGYHSVSNGALDDPWPKMARGVARLREYIDSSLLLVDSQLLDIMQDRHRAPLSELPETGIDAERELALSSIFVEGAVYGTRTSSILLFGAENLEITEQNYSSTGPTSVARYTLPL